MPILVDKIMVGNEEVDKVIIQNEVIYQKQPIASFPYTLWEGTIGVGDYYQVFDIPFVLPAQFSYPANVRITTMDFGPFDVNFSDSSLKEYILWLEPANGQPSQGDYSVSQEMGFNLDASGLHFDYMYWMEGIHGQVITPFPAGLTVTKIEVIE